MMKLTARSAALVALTLFAGTANAQVKIGYTDHEVLLANMPQADSVQSALQAEVRTSQAALQTQSQELQTKAEEYQRRQSLLSAEARQQREQELAGLQQALQQASQAAEQRLSVRQSELMRPLFERLQNAIDAEAQAQSLDLVIPTQIGGQPAILYVNRERVVDITAAVARRLGIPEQPGGAAAGARPRTGGNN